VPPSTPLSTPAVVKRVVVAGHAGEPVYCASRFERKAQPLYGMRVCVRVGDGVNVADGLVLTEALAEADAEADTVLENVCDGDVDVDGETDTEAEADVEADALTVVESDALLVCVRDEDFVLEGERVELRVADTDFVVDGD
jgi:hypothetical protein